VVRAVIVNSVGVGLAVVALAFVLARSQANSRSIRPITWPEMIPPLAIGIGALACVGIARMFVEWSRARSAFGPALEPLVGLFDPDRTPYVLLVLTLATVLKPIMRRSLSERRRAFRPVLYDAALTLGATSAQARQLSGRSPGPSLGAVALTFSLAVTNVAPALVLCPTADVRTLGPAVILRADEPGGRLQLAACLALMGIGLATTAMAIDRRDERRLTT
jgi:hypothetical protein